MELRTRRLLLAAALLAPVIVYPQTRVGSGVSIFTSWSQTVTVSPVSQASGWSNTYTRPDWATKVDVVAYCNNAATPLNVDLYQVDSSGGTAGVHAKIGTWGVAAADLRAPFALWNNAGVTGDNTAYQFKSSGPAPYGIKLVTSSSLDAGKILTYVVTWSR